MEYIVSAEVAVYPGVKPTAKTVIEPIDMLTLLGLKHSQKPVNRSMGVRRSPVRYFLFRGYLL